MRDLDLVALAELAELRDPQGLLSVYIDRDPRDQGTEHPRWSVELRNQVRDLRARFAGDLPHADREALLGGLDRVEEVVTESVAPGRFGRGWAVFIGLGDGATRSFAFQLPTESRVVLGEGACLWPAVRALRLGSPAGLISVSRAGITAHDWRMGKAAPLTLWTLDLMTDDWRMKKGPAPPIPALDQQSATQSDRYAQRIERHVRSFVASHGEDVRRLSHDQGWETVVVAADPRLGGIMAAGFPGEAVGVVQVDRLVEGLPSDELARELWPTLERERDRVDRMLVERVVDAAHRGAGGVLGLADTLSALEGGRVAELLMSDDRAADRGSEILRMPTESEKHPAERRDRTTQPRRLPTERLIRQALATNARIVPLDSDQAGPLQDADGIGALLRGS